MNAHKRQVVLAILEVLHQRDGGLMGEPLLHGQVAARTYPPSTLSDFEDTLKFCEGEKWVIGITDRLGSRSWAITPDGEAFRRTT